MQKPVLGGSTNAVEDHSAARSSDFVRNVFSLLERTEYRRCEKGDDLEDIYRLRYKAYHMNGVIPDASDHLIHDDLDDVPNAYKFGVYVDQRLVSTLRIHHVTAETPWSASYQTFGDILQPMLDEGLTFVCMSRLGSDPEWSKQLPQLPYVTMRLAGMACLYFNVPYGLSTVREDHGGFYRRIYRSKRIGPGRPYPGFMKKVELYMTDAHTDQASFFERFPFFQSTVMERRMLFGTPGRGELAPLTVLPTAKFLAHAA
ncbi:MAG: hypothetical protein M9944_05780 [Rhizobiaceae bacterium]|nr:hypothetical protein [Rhizobiaceae bacterium]